jgi:phosphoglycolate phosphatase
VGNTDFVCRVLGKKLNRRHVKSPSPRLIVFDLDGTLVDSRRDLADSANAVLAHYGCPTQAEDRIGRMVGDGAATLVARVFAAAGREQPPEALDRFLAIYNRRLLQWTRPYDGIVEALSMLARRATLAVLTNKPLAPAREILAGLDMDRFFPAPLVVGGDGPFPRKPDPAGLRELARHTGAVISEIVLVGDSVIDFRTARAAGVRIWLARYGFGVDGFPVHELRSDDRILDRPEHLTAM